MSIEHDVPDPEFTGDTDQHDPEDTLIDRGVDDYLDEGYTVPERPRPNHWGETAYEAEVGETSDMRLAQEEPEVWEREPVTDEDRAGRLAADPRTFEDRINDVYALDEGIDGGAASAEEAAVHVVDEDEQP